MKKEQSKKSIGLRSRNHIVQRSENPHPLQHYSVSLDKEGKPVFTPCLPIEDELAEDSSILNNALYQHPSAPKYRINEDMVDFDTNINPLIGNENE